ncbi:MAG TPA: histidine kinase dimerization/phospho-acceptor domain-containing protein [Chloroflexota bacterium]
MAGVLTITLTLALVVWLIRGPVLRPLAAVSEAVEGIAGGDLTVHLPSSPVREIAEVTAALEGMSGALRDALARQSALEDERRLFVGAIVHDLRTPLFTLRAYLRGLRTGIAATPEKVREYVDECITKADALERLVSDLFAFTRLEYLEQEPDRTPLELGALLRQMIEGARPPPLLHAYQQRRGQEPVHHDRPRGIGRPDRRRFLLGKARGQTPGVLRAERVDCFVLDLPGDDGPPLSIPLHDPRDEGGRGREQRAMRGRRDENAFLKRLSLMMRWDEELGIAERLHGAHADDSHAPPTRRPSPRTTLAMSTLCIYATNQNQARRAAEPPG